MSLSSLETPDDDLEHARPHCDQFYKEKSISSYFNTRLAVLAAVNQNREQFIEWADAGIKFHGLHITIPSVESDDETSDPPSATSDPLQWYIQTETISLLHHSLETFLRLYTGLVDAAHWIDPLIALTDRDRNLPALVQEHISPKPKESMRSDVSYLLLGRSEVQDDDPDALRIVDNLSGIVKLLAHRWLDVRRPYNAIKHGLLVAQSNASFRVGLTPEELVTIGDGPSIAYLDHTNWERQPPSEDAEGGKRRKWAVETQWIRFGEASKIIAAACMLIDLLWSLAVARWSEADIDEVRLEIPDPDEINTRTLLTGDSSPPGRNMSWKLFDEIKPD